VRGGGGERMATLLLFCGTVLVTCYSSKNIICVIVIVNIYDVDVGDFLFYK